MCCEHNIIYANAYAIDRNDDKQKKFQDALRHTDFNVKLKPCIQGNDGSAKGDWDAGITIDILEQAPDALYTSESKNALRANTMPCFAISKP